MAEDSAPIAIRETLTLTSLGIKEQFVTFPHVTMESEKYICVRQTNDIIIIDMAMPMKPLRRPIIADSALMNPNTRILALKAQIPGTTYDHLQIFNIVAQTTIMSHQMPEPVVFWKWITAKSLGLVTRESVYHWSIEGDSVPFKVFDMTANLVNNLIINYRCDPSEKWLVLTGIAPGAPERPQLVQGNMQLFSVDQKKSQAFGGHAASFATFKVAGNENPSTLICFASKTTNAGQITSKLHVIELGAQTGKPVFTQKQTDILFPPDFQDDFPVAMQTSQKYGLVYVITKLGLLYVYDLETAAAVYRNRICSDPIFLTAESSITGGFYAINRRGQVLLATVNDATIVPFVSSLLKNPELAMNLANRANLPVAENLFVQKFQQLFAQEKYKEAAEVAANSPQGLLRTPETVVKFQSVPVRDRQTPPLMQYFATLLTQGKLNAYESLELSRLVLKNKKKLVEEWLKEDKLECSEELGDLVKTVDSDLALKIYIAAFAERREFDKILIYSKQASSSVSSLVEEVPLMAVSIESSKTQRINNASEEARETSTKVVQRSPNLYAPIVRDNSRDLELNILESILEGRDEPCNLKLSLLELITENFSSEYRIGRGGCGEVFKGILPNGIVAVKRLFKSYTMEEKMFDQEVKSMMMVKHQNIVRLLGYCSDTQGKAMPMAGNIVMAEERERLLCFEYIKNGSLENHLTDELRGLDWCTRYQIIKGICEGLHHLHKEKSILHMDLKPANILIDEQMVPKITDFGLSRPDEKSRTMSTQRLVSPGYCAPEYLFQGKISNKSDIYSLGIIILEMVTGSKEKPDITKVLGRWRLRWNKSSEHSPLWHEQMVKCLELALRCVHKNPISRPFIWDIIRELNDIDNRDGKIRDSTQSTTEEISPYCLNDMLGIEPLEVRFPFVHDKEISCSIKLTNDTDYYIAFMVSTTSLLPYNAEPKKDIIPPKSMCCVTITLPAQEKAPLHNQAREEIYVQSTRVDEGLATRDITENMFYEEVDKVVHEVNLKVVFDMQPLL